jgi:Glycosyl transferase family 2/Glycosyl transferases group 1
MKLLFLDSTAIVPSGPGSPAFFSRYAVAHLRSQNHDVTILPHFDAAAAQAADAVITEWANEEAYEAAASGLCKRLVVRLRGFDAHGPLDRLEWGNVDALVYESPLLKSYVEKRFPGLRGFRSHVIPSGIDLANIPFKERKPGPVVAMVGRADAAKGYQLAFEWARQQPDFQLHVGIALGESNPRLIEYLTYVKPPNVTLHGPVDTVKWLDEIGANYLLSASIWETLGYTIAEAMALGIKPLIHDTPGVAENWPPLLGGTPRLWTKLEELDILTDEIYYPSDTSSICRAFVEERLDAAKQSAKFADLVLSLPARTQNPRTDTINSVLLSASHAVQSADLATVDASVLRFRELAPAVPQLVDSRVGLALTTAFRYYAADDLPRARTWALRAMADEASVVAMCLLGEIALGEDDLEGAERWYTAACALEPVPSRYGDGRLVEGREERLAEILSLLDPKLDGGELPDRYLIVVAVRNAEKYIGGCLESVKTQQMRVRPFLCVVRDDDSTDKTYEIASAYSVSTDTDRGILVTTQGPRKYSLRNIVETIRAVGQPGDVVIILDGDDQLAPDALQRLNYTYRRGAWLTYGNFITSSGKRSWMPPYPLKALREGLVRKFPWRVSHPKTFKFELFEHLTDEDFTHEGKWFQTAGDVALMLPMLELAAERSVYIPDTLYVYNDVNDANDHKVDPDGQVRVRDLIYAKPAKKRLEKL